MGCMLDKPICSKTGDAGEGNSLRWAVASMQGWRCEMEDTHAVRSGLYQTCAPDASVNASTTSASGSPTAQKAADDHPTTTTTATVTTTTVTANDTANSSNTPASSPAKRAASPTVASAAAAAAAGVVANATGPESKATFGDWSFFAVFDGHAGERSAVYSSKHLLDAILSTDAFQQGRCVEGIRTGFLGMDEALRTSSIQPDSSGSTAIAAFVSPQHVYLANCGDSRAIFCRNGAPAFSTQDHKPVLPGERERILKAGGSVIIQRVNGSLAVSRALGDFEYKNVLGFGQCAQLVSPEPEVFCIDRDLKADQFMVLACDGIWDVMSNEDVCAFVASRLRVTDDLRTITNAVIDTCFHKGSRDNMSIIIVAFPGCPQPTAEAIEADAVLNQKLVEIVKAQAKGTLDVIIEDIKDRKLPGLPPGAGLEGVYPIILETYRANNDEATDESVLKDLATLT